MKLWSIDHFFSSWKFSFQLIFLNLQYKTHHCRVLSPTQALSRTDTKLTHNWLSIQITFSFRNRESLVPSKTSVASLSFALSPLHHIHGHRSLRAGVKNKLELRSNSVPLLLSSRSQFTAIKMGLTSHPPPSSNGRGGAGPPVQLPILAVSVTGSSGVGHLPPSWW